MEYKCALFDIDNTLFSHAKDQIPPSTIEAINTLKKQNYKIVVATGRGLALVQEEVFALKPDYWIVSNGQQIFDRNKNLLYSIFINKELIEKVNAYAFKHGYGLIWKFEEGEWLYTSYEDFKTNWPHWLKGWNFIVSNNQDEHLKMNCIGGCLLTDISNHQAFEENFKDLVLLPQKQDNADITLKGISKYTGMQFVLDVMKIKENECIAFGDQKNDAEMLKYSAIGIAMGNASDDAKRAADYITSDIDDDGIYNALKHFDII